MSLTTKYQGFLLEENGDYEMSDLEEQSKEELVQEILRCWSEIRQLENYIKGLQEQNRELQKAFNNVK